MSRTLSYLGLGALTAGGAALFAFFLFIDPIVVWFSWNWMHFGAAIGLHGLPFWGIILLTLFIACGSAIRLLIAAIVFLSDPNWFKHGAALMHFPSTTWHNFIAVALLILVATSTSSSSSSDS